MINSNSHPSNHTSAHASLDMELISQRILKLAEIATLEHLNSLVASQADGLLALTGDLESALLGMKHNDPGTPRW